MDKYKVYGVMTTNVCLGEYEASSKADAITQADRDKEAPYWPSLCHQCATEIELGDIYDTQAEKVGGEK